MNWRLRRLTLGLLFLMPVSGGCASDARSNGTTTATAAPAIKPMDQVQQDIVAVKQQLSAALSVARTGSGDLRASVSATESAIANLRTTLNQLDQRADEYLDMWSRQATVTITGAGVYKSPNAQPTRSKAKYDHFLSALRAARDEINPTIVQLKQLAQSDASPDSSQLVGDARKRGSRGIDRLDQALTLLGELKASLRQP